MSGVDTTLGQGDVQFGQCWIDTRGARWARPERGTRHRRSRRARASLRADLNVPAPPISGCAVPEEWTYDDHEAGHFACQARRFTPDLVARLRLELLRDRVAQAALTTEHLATATALTGQTDVDSILERELADASAARARDAIPGDRCGPRTDRDQRLWHVRIVRCHDPRRTARGDPSRPLLRRMPCPALALPGLTRPAAAAPTGAAGQS